MGQRSVELHCTISMIVGLCISLKQDDNKIDSLNGQESTVTSQNGAGTQNGPAPFFRLRGARGVIILWVRIPHY